MRTTKKALASVLAACMLVSTSAVSGFAAVADGSVGADTYYAQKAQAVDADYAYDGELGALYTPESTTFKVWAPAATAVTLNRYATGSNAEDGAKNLGTKAMEKLMDGSKWTGVWTTTVSGDLVNTYYTYTVTTRRVGGTSTKITNETQDVYSRATGVNGKRTMIVDLDKTDPAGWSSDSHVLLDKATDSNVWEIHVKDFSYDTASGVSEANRGKYLAFTETGTTLNNEGNIATCIDYLKNLGITTVQINPFYDFMSIDERGSDDQFNWGYDPQNYNVPEGSYSSNPYDGNVRINECKQMIKALHDAGFSVVMDVVYNHTFSSDPAGSCFQATVPNYYYRLTSEGTFSSGSGCGNDVACERAMVRKFIVESCRYWVDEYHVDGFRFDLMGLMDAETINAIRDNLDEVDPRITMWGEGWDMGSTHDSVTCTGNTYIAATQANSSSVSERVGFFNDYIRDAIKGSVFDASDPGFIGGVTKYAAKVLTGTRANTDTDGTTVWRAKAPTQTVTYADCHDNRTLYDQIFSANNLGTYGTRNDEALAMNRMAAAIIYTSQGVAFTLAGQEMARSKDGDHNSYKSAPTLNMIKWNNLVDYADLVSYYSGLMEIRKNFAPFTAADSSAKYTDIANLSDCIYYVAENDTAGQWKKLAVLCNSSSTEKSITLQKEKNSAWVIISDGVLAGVEKLGEVSGTTFTVPARSEVIAVDKASFESTALASSNGTVTVKYVDKQGKDIVNPMIIKGKIGSGYQTAPSGGISNIYEVKEIIGDAAGVYTEEPKEVTYVYTDYIPPSIKNFGDVNQDGDIDINDVTAYQKHIAEIKKLPAEIADGIDFNYDGAKDISDVTMLQKHLADIAVSSGKVIVTYYLIDSEGNASVMDNVPPETVTGRVGDEYKAPEYKVMGLALNKTDYPAEVTGIIPYGAAKKVDLYYGAGSLDVTLHVKHNGDLTWTPYFWIWGSNLKGADSGNFSGGSWPGKAAVDPDGDGWYEYSFTYKGTGTYNVIVSNKGTPQTIDYKGFVDNDLWMIIDDEKVSSGNQDFLTFYTENPDANPDAPIATHN